MHWCSSCRLKLCLFMQGLSSCISISTLGLHHSRCKCTHTQSADVLTPRVHVYHTQSACVFTPRVHVYHIQSACVLTLRVRVYYTESGCVPFPECMSTTLRLPVFHTQSACAPTLRMPGQVSVVTPRAGEGDLPPEWHLSPCAQLSQHR